MFKKSLSDLSTTIFSVKDSIISKTNESDSEQIEISALIASYSIEEDSKKLLFRNTYALFELKLYTPYKIWTIHKRYSQFLQLKKQLESKNVKNMPKLPPKIFFINEKKLNERQLLLEEFINELFKAVNILKYQIILDFIECPQEIIDIFMFNTENLNSSIIMNSNFNNNINYYNGRISTNKNNIYNYNEINNNNFYSSIENFQSKNRINSFFDNNNDSFEEETSPGTLVIQEFLRNLMDSSYKKTELLFQFEFFLKNKKNNFNKNSINNWYFLDINDIKIFFNGFYSNISHSKINGFLYHCGNIQINKIGAQKCLEFLNKILSEDFNPQAKTFLEIFKSCQLENIIQMELENHIIDNLNSNRINAFMILYKYVGTGRYMEKKIKRILMCLKAEELFMNWFDKQII